jgi:outer membrane protein
MRGDSFPDCSQVLSKRRQGNILPLCGRDELHPPKPRYVRSCRVTLLVLWICLTSQPLIAEESALRLRLDDAIRVALVKSPRITQVLAQLDIAREQVQIVAAAKRLFINIQAGGARIQPAQVPVIQANVGGVSTDFQASPNFAYYTIEGAVIFRKLLLDGGLTASKIAASKSEEKSTRYKALAEWRLLHFEIESAYIDVLRAEEQIVNAKASLELARTNLSTAEKRFAVGQVPRGDIVFAQVPLAQAELQLERSTFARQSAGEHLLELIGLPQDTPLEVTKFESTSPPPESVEIALEQAFSDRFDLKAAEMDVEAAAQTLRASRKENDPRIVVGGTVNPLGFDGQNLAQGGYRVGVQLEWPILNGNVVSHQIKAAEADCVVQTAGLRLKKQQIEREVREAFRDVRLARIATDSSRLQVEQASESLRIAQGQYRAGLAGFTVVNEQQRELVRVQGEHTLSAYSLLVTRAKLALVIGTDVIEELQLTADERVSGQD